MKDLDFRPILLGDTNFYRAARKLDALQFAKINGWRAQDVTRVANRFQQFWVVSACVQNDLRILNRDGSYSDIPFPGYW